MPVDVPVERVMEPSIGSFGWETVIIWCNGKLGDGEKGDTLDEDKRRILWKKGVVYSVPS